MTAVDPHDPVPRAVGRKGVALSAQQHSFSVRPALNGLIWNGTLDQSKPAGSGDLDRRVTVRLTGLRGPHTLRRWRIDADHGNVAARWHTLGGDADWPTPDQWASLTTGDRLDETAPPRTLTLDADGTAELTIDLPNPGIAYLEAQPGTAEAPAPQQRTPHL